jgi:hypothetical protein
VQVVTAKRCEGVKNVQKIWLNVDTLDPHDVTVRLTVLSKKLNVCNARLTMCKHRSGGGSGTCRISSAFSFITL